MLRNCLLALCLFTPAFGPAQASAQPPSIADFARLPEFTVAEISPDGRYLALAAPAGDQTGIAILDISAHPKLKVISAQKLTEHEHVADMMWADDERVLFTSVRQKGTLNKPRQTGRLYAMNADGSRRKVLIEEGDRYYGFSIIDLLPEDPERILVMPYAYNSDWPRADKLLVSNGRMSRHGVSPLEGGWLFSDSRGDVRFAFHVTEDLVGKIAYRESMDAEWLKKDLPFGGHITVHGFTADDKAILVGLQRDGGMGLYRFDPASMDVAPVITNANVGADVILKEIGNQRKIAGATFQDGKPQNLFVDEESLTAKVYRMLEGAFPGMHVVITSTTRDGMKSVVAVSSDKQPTQYYLFDLDKKQVGHLVGTRSWVDAGRMAERKPIRYTASDGVEIHGYLTLPTNGAKENLPLVTIVHGGPYETRDAWQWDNEAQLLATRGYGVLQVNFRGSGGYGDNFEDAGNENWGTRVQDDITDGVRWAVEQGIADEERLCIYGGSFGGYSVASQLVRHPELFKCGFAFVGVYDLNLMFEKGDVQDSDQGVNFLKMRLGEDAKARAAQSPVHQVENIKSALYVAHGEKDVRAHVEHYHRLIEALEEKKVPHRKLLVEKEGHGFYAQENREKLYSELVEFIDEHIGQ